VNAEYSMHWEDLESFLTEVSDEQPEVMNATCFQAESTTQFLPADVLPSPEQSIPTIEHEPEILEQAEPEIPEHTEPEILGQTELEILEQAESEMPEQTDPEIQEQTEPEIPKQTKPEIDLRSCLDQYILVHLISPIKANSSESPSLDLSSLFQENKGAGAEVNMSVFWRTLRRMESQLSIMKQKVIPNLISR